MHWRKRHNQPGFEKKLRRLTKSLRVLFRELEEKARPRTKQFVANGDRETMRRFRAKQGKQRAAGH